LYAVGPEALSELSVAASTSKDSEIHLRADRLVKKIAPFAAISALGESDWTRVKPAIECLLEKFSEDPALRMLIYKTAASGGQRAEVAKNIFEAATSIELLRNEDMPADMIPATISSYLNYCEVLISADYSKSTTSIPSTPLDEKLLLKTKKLVDKLSGTELEALQASYELATMGEEVVAHLFNIGRETADEARCASAVKLAWEIRLTPESILLNLGRKLALEELSAGNYKQAKELAIISLKRNAEQGSKDDLIHEMNLALGTIALEAGDHATAGVYLVEAAKVKGSPVLNSFGPGMALAKKLLQSDLQKNKKAVLAYLQSCRMFWKMGTDKLDLWCLLIEHDRIPDFKNDDR
jgi:hypothetical protein